MKILHFLGSTSIGGVASIVYDLSYLAVQKGHQVDILSMCNEDYLIDSTGKFDRLGITTFRSETPERYNLKQLKSLRKLMDKYDVIHVHQFPEQMYGAVTAVFRKKNKNPIIVTTEHSTWNNRRNHPFLRCFDRTMYSRYDKVVCISPPTEKELNKWLKSEKLRKKITTITNGIDIVKYSEAENRIVDYIPINKGDYLIGMVGRMEHPKDPFTLIKALPHLPENVKLVFMGDGEIKQEVENLISRLNLKDRVFLLGNVPDASVILKGCKIGVLSTHWDGFGLVAAEYMACGIPAVVSDVEGLKEVVGDEDLLFKPQDSKRLAEILNKLISDKGFYESKVLAGKERVKRFSREVMGDKYLELYKTLLEEKR